jgi:hypothetical protein
MNEKPPALMTDDELSLATAKRPKRILVIHEQVIADLHPFTPEAVSRLRRRWEENARRREALADYRECRSEMVKRVREKKSKVIKA